MASLPVISGKQAVSAFKKAGWQIARRKGSHIILIKPLEYYTLSIPNHKELDRGTLRSIIRKSGMTISEFLLLLN
ncbi:MAG: type II toxin-antitoxin system HicA family toxin [Sphaerochaetaceae bacterium]|nr:type II toxin-antitoxin system HicA family toxin [Sphaerochaetaceae bacterium]